VALGLTSPGRGAGAYAGSVLPNGSDKGWERAFWFVFSETTNPMCLLDEQRRVVEVNNATLATVQRSRGEVIGKPANEFIAPSDRAEAARRWQSILQTEAGEYHSSGTVLRSDGAELEIDFAAHMVRLSGRRLAVYVMLKGGKTLSVNRRRGSQTTLTPRERQVVTSIAMGHETPRIAKELHISQETVRTHVRNAMSKLAAHTRAQLVAKVVGQEGILRLPHLED
jgi:PAS domain S-box-containing protein